MMAIYRPKVAICLLAATLVASCGPAQETSGRVFALVDEEIYDAPLKTQIQQYFVAPSDITQQEIRDDIQRLYKKAIARTGFRYHRHPTNIYIYIYGSEEKARRGQNLWVAMGSKNFSDSGLSVDVNEGRLAALTTPPEERFGLSEETRQGIFKESVAAEDRALAEAMERFPDPDFQRQGALSSNLREQYNAEVARKYGLTEEELGKIAVEGLMKGWLLD